MYGREIQRGRVALLVSDDHEIWLANPLDLGLPASASTNQQNIALLAKDSMACFVGFQPRRRVEIVTSLKIARQEPFANIKADQYEIRKFLTSHAPDAPPVPLASTEWRNYREQLTDGWKACPNIVLARDALKKANKIALPRDDCANFVNFISSVITSLADVSNRAAAGDGLDVFFRARDHILFAPSGDEVFRYTDPATSQSESSHFHLKPSRELGGMRNPGQKPRIYFAMRSVDGATTGVYVLYVGPHPAGEKEATFDP
jgi:hypothetical protein